MFGILPLSLQFTVYTELLALRRAYTFQARPYESSAVRGRDPCCLDHDKD